MANSIHCTTAAPLTSSWIAITTLTTFTLHTMSIGTRHWCDLISHKFLISLQFYISKLFTIFSKYSRFLKIWGTFAFFSQNLHEIWSLKPVTCCISYTDMCRSQVCRSNVLTGVKWMPRYFRWQPLTSMQNRTSPLFMYWGQWGGLGLFSREFPEFDLFWSKTKRIFSEFVWLLNTCNKNKMWRRTITLWRCQVLI